MKVINEIIMLIFKYIYFNQKSNTHYKCAIFVDVQLILLIYNYNNILYLKMV